MPLSTEDRDATMNEPLVAVLSIGRDAAERAPLSVPLWYAFEAPDRLWLLTGEDSAKHRALSEGARVSLCVQRTTPTIRYVTAEARVDAVRSETPEEMRVLASRYLEGEALEGYMAMVPSLGAHVRVDLTVEHWLSADLG